MKDFVAFLIFFPLISVIVLVLLVQPWNNSSKEYCVYHADYITIEGVTESNGRNPALISICASSYSYIKSLERENPKFWSMEFPKAATGGK